MKKLTISVDFSKEGGKEQLASEIVKFIEQYGSVIKKLDYVTVHKQDGHPVGFDDVPAITDNDIIASVNTAVDELASDPVCGEGEVDVEITVLKEGTVEMSIPFGIIEVELVPHMGC